MTLEKFLETADVPVLRKDLTKTENVNWLRYNMWIRNRNLPGFVEAELELQMLHDNIFKK